MDAQSFKVLVSRKLVKLTKSLLNRRIRLYVNWILMLG